MSRRKKRRDARTDVERGALASWRYVILLLGRGGVRGQ